MTLTVAAARKLVGLKPGDATRDARLGQLIAAAYEQATDRVGPLVATSVTETACNRGGQLLLSRPPVSAVTSIAGVTDLAGLRVSARYGLVEGLPSAVPSGDVLVAYIAGYATVPASVEEGVRLWVRHRWGLESYASATYSEDDVGPVTDFSDLPNAVRSAWGPYLLDRGGFA